MENHYRCLILTDADFIIIHIYFTFRYNKIELSLFVPEILFRERRDETLMEYREECL